MGQNNSSNHNNPSQSTASNSSKNTNSNTFTLQLPTTPNYTADYETKVKIFLENKKKEFEEKYKNCTPSHCWHNNNNSNNKWYKINGNWKTTS